MPCLIYRVPADVPSASSIGEISSTIHLTFSTFFLRSAAYWILQIWNLSRHTVSCPMTSSLWWCSASAVTPVMVTLSATFGPASTFFIRDFFEWFACPWSNYPSFDHWRFQQRLVMSLKSVLLEPCAKRISSSFLFMWYIICGFIGESAAGLQPLVFKLSIDLSNWVRWYLLIPYQRSLISLLDDVPDAFSYQIKQRCLYPFFDIIVSYL